MSLDQPPVKAPRLLTIDEAAAHLRVCRATVYEMFKAGQLTWVPVGRSRRVPAADIENYVERMRDKAAAA